MVDPRAVRRNVEVVIARRDESRLEENMQYMRRIAATLAALVLALTTAPAAGQQGLSEGEQMEMGLMIVEAAQEFDVSTDAIARFDNNRMEVTDEGGGHVRISYSTGDAEVCRFVGVMGLAVVMAMADETGSASGSVVCTRHRIALSARNSGGSVSLVQSLRSDGSVVYRRAADGINR